MISKLRTNVVYVLIKTWKYEKPILLIILLQLMIRVLTPFISIYLPSVILSGLTGNIPIDIMFIRGFVLILILTICNCTNTYITAIYDTHIMNNKMHFLTDLFRKKMELDYTFIESGNGQKMYQYALTTLLDDNQGISGMLRTLGELLGNICSVLLYIGIIASLDKGVVLVLVVISAIHLLTLNVVLGRKHSKRNFGVEIDRKINYLFRYIPDGRNNKEIKLFSMQGWLLKNVDLLIKEKMIWVKNLAGYDFLAALSDIILLIIRDGIAYYVVFQAIIHNELAISEFVFFFGAITTFSGLVTGITGSLAYIVQKSREVDGLRDYIERKDDSHVEKTLAITSDEKLCIELIHVSFRYEEGGPYILNDLNLKINKGEKVALIGENGAGKTTLVKLICGFYKPTKGKILFNGVDTSELSQECIRSIFASVFQDIHILPISAAENIAFDDAQKDDKEIEKCIEYAGLKEDLPDINVPLTKMLHREGIILSGGQEQKLVLARAIYKMRNKNAAALVLDEPTAALDPIAERELYLQYGHIAKGKTSLFISHRLASTQFCDVIVMLGSGEILQKGTHKQLLSVNGKYRELYDIQSQYYG